MAVVNAQKTHQLDAAAYARAERLLPENRSKLVDAARVRPRWVDGGARFWYRVDGPAGHRFVLVDPATASKRPAFDHERLADALAATTGGPVDSAALPFPALELQPGAVRFFAFGAHWHCSLDEYACERVEGHAPRNPLEVTSPDSKWVAFRRGYDLWLRSAETGEERALTSDQLDSMAFAGMMRKLGLPGLPPLVAWSPDSRLLLTHRTDQRKVRLQHLVESAPAGGGRPVLHSFRYAMPGDEIVPRAELLSCS
jgi:hypothetical protein